MGERKGTQYYYPPDFNPAKIPRMKKPENEQKKIRDMLPMSIRCKTCGNYMYKGTKFNSRKEVNVGQTYLGIKTYRFYLKCTQCLSEITYTTDPQNSDYSMEFGALRNFEPWRTEDEQVEETGDSMELLENKRSDAKRKMDHMSALGELKSMKSRRANVSVDKMLESLKQSNKVDEDDRELIKSIFQVSSKQKKNKKISQEVSMMKTTTSNNRGGGSLMVPNIKFSVEKKPKKPRNVLLLLSQQYDEDEE